MRLLGLLALGHMVIDINYYIEVLHGDPTMVGTLLGVFLGAGVLGTLAAGPIADRVGMRRFMVGTLLLIVPIAMSFLIVIRPYAVLVLGILGFVLVSTFTVSVVLGQAYMPRNPGMASGMIVGFAIGAGGLGATALGGIADRWGLGSALWISAVMPLGAFVAALFLPEPRAR